MNLSALIRANLDHAAHGTKGCYDRHKCRCLRCTSANTAYMRAYRRQKMILGFQAEQRRKAS